MALLPANPRADRALPAGPGIAANIGHQSFETAGIGGPEVRDASLFQSPCPYSGPPQLASRGAPTATTASTTLLLRLTIRVSFFFKICFGIEPRS